MTLLERKAEFIKALLNDNIDEEKLSELEMVYDTLTSEKKSPCQYSTEETKIRALKSIEHMQKGAGISHEEMKKRYSI